MDPDPGGPRLRNIGTVEPNHTFWIFTLNIFVEFVNISTGSVLKMISEVFYQ
jgi:hypothetical protein